LLPVSGAGGHIARQGESCKRSHCDVVCATDPGFKHTTTPNRYLALTTNSFNLLRLRVSAHAAKLQVDYFARPQRDCMLCVFARLNRFIEPGRTTYLVLMLSVIESVVVCGPLFDLHDRKLVH